MAYNSDGYIMIDFTEVDFRRTNQTIEGLFKRCVDVIGTNKFILVINANGRTPLPATCSFTNNQYVIDTCIYMFAISSNDNLFIRRNDVPASDIIDDSSISVDKTWSSNKIDSSLADYQPLLTPVSPISISEDDEISVDLSSKQNVLTAGDNTTIIGDVISSNQIKSFTYTGNGQNTRRISFSEAFKCILDIGFVNNDSVSNIVMQHLNFPIYPNQVKAMYTKIGISGTSYMNNIINLTYDDNDVIVNGTSAETTLNLNNIEYTVYYI